MLSKKWSSIESDFLDYYQGDSESLPTPSADFLELIDFTEDGTVAEVGKAYLQSKYIRENEYYKEILRSGVLKLREIRELCQTFYGQETKRENVEVFFKGETDIDDDSEIGRVLMLINYLDIVNYSKKNGTVRFKQYEQVEEQGQTSYRITTRTPYSNVKRLRRCLRECEGEVRWIDKHFSKKGLEPLSDEIEEDRVKRIKILCGTGNANIGLRDDFKRFKKEMKNRGIDSSLKVITSDEIYHEIHDRWVLSDSVSWNIPPIDSLYQNQEAEIHKTDESVPFNEWWNSAHDIISEWNEIQKARK
jgi:hypothetical protein